MPIILSVLILIIIPIVSLIIIINHKLYFTFQFHSHFIIMKNSITILINFVSPHYLSFTIYFSQLDHINLIILTDLHVQFNLNNLILAIISNFPILNSVLIIIDFPRVFINSSTLNLNP